MAPDAPPHDTDGNVTRLISRRQAALLLASLLVLVIGQVAFGVAISGEIPVDSASAKTESPPPSVPAVIAFFGWMIGMMTLFATSLFREYKEERASGHGQSRLKTFFAPASGVNALIDPLRTDFWSDAFEVLGVSPKSARVLGVLAFLPWIASGLFIWLAFVRTQPPV